MRKLVVLVLALIVIRLLPRAVRQQVRAMELITAMMQIAAMATANTSMTYNTAQRTAALETRTGNLEQGVISNVQPSSTVGTIQTQVSALSGAATSEPNVSSTVVLTSDVEISGAISQTSDIYGGINGGTSSGGPNAGSGVAAHTHGIGHVHSHGHTHSYGHDHFLPT